MIGIKRTGMTNAVILVCSIFCLLPLKINIFAQQSSSTVNESFSDDASGVLASAAGFSSEPRLVTGGMIEIPTVLYKKGVEGTISIEVDIDKTGLVEKCKIIHGLYPLLDSIVCTSILNSVYTPAYESGKAIAASVSTQLTFNLDSMVIESKNAVPEIKGMVLDRSTNLPISGAVVHMQYKDSLCDPDLSISFERYIKLIGKVPGQSNHLDIISTYTDSLGQFAFRLLPVGPVILSIQSEGFELTHIEDSVKKGYQKKIKCFLDPLRLDTLNTIVVFGQHAKSSETIMIEKQEISTGLTHYLSDIVTSQATIRQVPEANSALLVRAGSPFDNRYLICGIPFLAPFHFGGYPYADIDGLMISALQNVNIIVDRIAGRYTDANGVIIEANPGIYRPAKKKLIKRPELAVDYSTMSQDILLSFPLNRKKDDFLQFGLTHSEAFTLKVLRANSGLTNESGIGVGSPSSFTNLTFTGSINKMPFQIESFAWLALDSYIPMYNEPTTIPWGMGSLKISPVNNKNISVLCGGSHQYLVSGKRVGEDVFLKKVAVSNCVSTLSIDSIVRSGVNIHLDCQLDYQYWHGSVLQHDTTGLDTSVLSQDKETKCQIHGYVQRQLGPVELSTDLLCTGLLYNQVPDLFYDGGVSLNLTIRNILTEIHFGRVTSRPDIRGLPDTLFRRKHLLNYLFSMPITFRGGPFAKISMQPYLRYVKQSPQMNPLLNTWDPEKTTPLTASGIDFENEVQLFQWLSINSAVNLSQAHREINKVPDSLYEWNVPWTIRGGIHFIIKKYFHLYVDGILMKGLPYFDFIDKKYEYLPNYSKIDLSFQVRTPMQPHRNLTRYDGYFEVKNISDNINIRDFYYDKKMNRTAIILRLMYVEFGLRVGFRL